MAIYVVILIAGLLATGTRRDWFLGLLAGSVLVVVAGIGADLSHQAALAFAEQYGNYPMFEHERQWGRLVLIPAGLAALSLYAGIVFGSVQYLQSCGVRFVKQDVEQLPDGAGEGRQIE